MVNKDSVSLIAIAVFRFSKYSECSSIVPLIRPSTSSADCVVSLDKIHKPFGTYD